VPRLEGEEGMVARGGGTEKERGFSPKMEKGRLPKRKNKEVGSCL